MKNLIYIYILLAMSNSFAEYQIMIPLEPNGINLNLPTEISGDSKLTPSTINRGESSTISWSYDYATEISIDGLGTYGKSGSVQVSPLASRNYTINAVYGNLSKTDNLFLTVIQPNSNISFTSSSNRIGIGQSALLNWNISNANIDSISIDNGIGSIDSASGSKSVQPTTDTTFTLSGFDYNDEPIISSLFIDVVNNSVINSFNASSLNVTTGNSVNFSWNVTDSEGLSLSNFGTVSGNPSGSQNITFDNAGAFDFTLSSTSLNGTIVSSTPININVYNPAIINSYTINGSNTTIDASPNQSLVFDWSANNTINYTLNGNSVNGNSTSLVADSSVGTTEYILSAFNGAGDSITSSLSVNVVGLPTINTFNAPTAVFINKPFNLSWTGTGISKYEIKSDNSNSGVATTAFDLGSSLNTNATPTVAGTYNYTLSGYNTANAKVDSIKSVIVEADPTFTAFTVNGATSVTVAPSATLTYASSGLSAGSTFVTRNSANSSAATNPIKAPATVGTYTYYAAATKTLNSTTRYSALRAVVVNVVETWIATTSTYTAWINSGGIYGCSNWTPSPSTINSGAIFTQTASNCSQAQTRNRQDREIETTTNAIRNKGSVVIESQILNNQSSSRQSTGTLPLDIGCKYDGQNNWVDSVGEWWGPISQGGYWNNESLYISIFEPFKNSITVNGYIYTRGSYIKQEITYNPGMFGGTEKTTNTHYQICKTPI